MEGTIQSRECWECRNTASEAGPLVWILAFYIFSLSVLKGDQFIFQHSSSTVHNGFTPWGASHQGGKRTIFWREAFLWIDRHRRKGKKAFVKHAASPAAWVCMLLLLPKVFVWKFGFRNVWVYAKMQSILQCNHQGELIWSARMLPFFEAFSHSNSSFHSTWAFNFLSRPDLSSKLILLTTTTTNLRTTFVWRTLQFKPADQFRMRYPCCGPWNLFWWSGIPSHRWKSCRLKRSAAMHETTNRLVFGNKNAKHVTRQEAEVDKLIMCALRRGNVKLYEPHVFLFNLPSPRSLAIPTKQHSVFGWWPLWQEVLLQDSKCSRHSFESFSHI